MYVRNDKKKFENHQIRKVPKYAIMHLSEKLSEEQFDYCVVKAPEYSLIFCREKLTKEQFDY